jgi:hypothetical protein
MVVMLNMLHDGRRFAKQLLVASFEWRAMSLELAALGTGLLAVRGSPLLIDRHNSFS